MRKIIPEPEFTLKPVSPVRRSIIERVTESFREIPQFDLHMEVNASNLKAARQNFKTSGENPPPGYNDMLIYCSARALKNHRCINAHFSREGIKEFSEINISFAVATDKGVLMPVIRNADNKNLGEISAESAELVNLAINGKLRASLQFHSTFSISSLGKFGIDSFNAIINPPQVAILAAGAIKTKPTCAGNEITTSPVIHLTLTVDHRAVDGDMAARFLAELKETMENFAAV